MTAPAPRQGSHLSDLPCPALNRSTSCSKSSLGFDDPRMATLYSASTSLTLPFPRQTSAEFFSRHSSTPSPSTAPSSPFELSSSPPTWPNPASYTFTQARKQSTPSSSSSSTSTLNAKVASSPRKTPSSLICFELALGDRLAAKLDEETTLRSIQEASGIISTELMNEQDGPQKLVSTGSASAVQKARQLLDAKLSQTPIRTVVGIKLDTPPPSSLTFIPSTGPHITRFQPLSSSTYRLVTSPLSSSSTSAAAVDRPRLDSPPSTNLPTSNLALTPSQLPSSSASANPIITAPTAELSTSDRVPCRSDSLVAQPIASPKEAVPNEGGGQGLPQVGDFGQRREGYVQALVDELEFAVKRRSLVRVKLDLGSQEWRREPRLNPLVPELDLGKETWGIEEIEHWRTENSGTTGISTPVFPTFSTALSRSTATRFLAALNHNEPRGGSSSTRFDKKTEISQVHIWHLDKSRASFGCAIAECRGQELRDLPKGCTASGTLVLKKCSTLPSKPFALSIVRPTLGSNRQVDGTDLRLKILADKAATSPSLDLSAAMQSATWEVDDLGEFRVKVDLKEERFGRGETEIRWKSRERWENQDESLRFTLSENRYSDSSKHDYSVELSSPILNRLLADYALDQAQGKKAKWERDRVRRLIDDLIVFGETFVERSAGLE